MASFMIPSMPFAESQIIKMKILSKFLGKMIGLVFLMWIFYFACRFSMIAVVSFRSFNLRDELYDFNKNGVALYIGSIILLLGVYLCIQYVAQNYISSKIFLVFAEIIGISMLVFAVDKWIDYLKILFDKYQLYDDNMIELWFQNLFESSAKARSIITAVIVTAFSFNMLYGNIEIILKGKPYIKAAFANNRYHYL